MRKLLLFLITLITCFALPTSLTAKELEKFTVALDWYINPDHAPMLIAQSLGYFNEAGLDVKFMTSADISQITQIVAAQKADIAIADPASLLIQVEAGMPLARVGTLVDQPLDSIMVLASSNIKKLSDLKNGKIAYAGGAINLTLLKVMLKHVGIVDSVQLINVKMNLSQALLSKRVDAVTGIIRTVEPIQLAAMGIKTRLFFPEDYGIPPYDEFVFVANKNSKNLQKLRVFLNAVKRATAYLKKHPEKSWQLVAKKYKTELAATDDMAKINREIWLKSIRYFPDDPATLNVERYQNFSQFLFKNKLLKTNLPVDAYTISLSL